VTRTAVWDAQAGIGGTISSSVRLRVTPADVSQGFPSATSNFTVNLVAPILSLITVGEIPNTMNGNTSYLDGSGVTQDPRLKVPAHGFRLGVEYAAGTGGGTLDLSSLRITCDTTMGALAAGSNLALQVDPGASSGAWQVSSTYPLAGGPATWTATIQDSYGNESSPASITADVTSAGGSSRPFDVADLWWVDFDLDQFTTNFIGGATVTVTTSVGGDGTPDFQEDLLILGLRTNSPTAACLSLDTNGILLTLAKTEVLGRLNEHFGKSYAGGDAGFNSGISFQATSSGSHSSIRIGGDDSVSGFTLGRAQFDYRNAAGNHNRSTTLGVFTTNMIQFYINSSFSFRNRFDPLISGRGTPAGEGALDHIVLAPTFDRSAPGNSFSENDRYDDIYDAVDALARSSSVILAHEIGHSIGLCANNPPPLGLFGGESDAPFSSFYTTAYHFDSTGNNLMAAALSFTTSLVATSSGYKFNELNEAYLREWIILE